MEAIVSDKGQITVPKSVRDQLGIRPGSRLTVEVQSDGSIRMRPMGRGSQGLFGLLHDPARAAVSVADMNQGVGEHLAQEDARVGGLGTNQPREPVARRGRKPIRKA
jgi:antitoxin PrlF